MGAFNLHRLPASHRDALIVGRGFNPCDQRPEPPCFLFASREGRGENERKGFSPRPSRDAKGEGRGRSRSGTVAEATAYFHTVPAGRSPETPIEFACAPLLFSACPRILRAQPRRFVATEAGDAR